MSDGNLDMLTEIHTDVRYIKKELTAHIQEDADLKKEIVYPLWQKYQQDIGVAKHMGLSNNRANMVATIVISVITAGATVLAALATAKGTP